MKKEVLRIIKTNSVRDIEGVIFIILKVICIYTFCTTQLLNKTNLRNSLLHCQNIHDYCKLYIPRKILLQTLLQNPIVSDEIEYFLFIDLYLGRIFDVSEARDTC